MNLRQKLGLGAAAILVASAGGAALAHPHPDGDGDGKTVERVIILRDGKGEHRVKEGERVRRFEIIREGEDHAGAGPEIRRFDMRGHGALVDCADGEKIVDESSGDGNEKTKVIICNKGAPTAATAKHLEDALARISASEHLSAEQKAKIETALRSAIDRARSAR